MKKYRKLNLRKFKVAKLANTFSVKGGVLTNGANCEPLNTDINDNLTIGINSCVNTVCNNKTYEFETCHNPGTVETRTGDSLIKPINIM